MTTDQSDGADFRKSLLTSPGERQDVEYKSAISFDDNTAFGLRLVKHILGMANVGGGWIVVGYKDGPLRVDHNHSQEIAATYDTTRLSAAVDKYIHGDRGIRLTVLMETHPKTQRGPARPPLQAEPGQPAHQREPGLRGRPSGGGGQRPRHHGRPLRRAHHRGRLGAAGELPELRPDARTTRGAVHPGGSGHLRPLPEYERAAASRRPHRLRQVTRLPRQLGVSEELSGDADPASRRARWPVLCRQQRGWGRVHPGGRGDPGDVRLPGGAGHRQCPQAPGGAAGQDRPGDPGEHHTRGRPGVRRQDGRRDVGQPGGQEDRQRPMCARRLGGATAGGADLPAVRREGCLAGGVPPGPRAAHGGDGAGRGDRPPVPRRAERHHPDQRHAHLLRGGRGRVGRRDPTGHDADGGAGAAAGRVPGHGEPRAEDAPGRRQGIGGYPSGIRLRPGLCRDDAVLQDHPRPVGEHALPDKRPAGRGTHRDGTLPVSLEPVEAGVLVDEARSRFQSGGGRSNLVIDLPPDLPRVMADRRRIVQALGNLLSNAAHHSNELSPIRVAAVRDGVHVAFSVADDGVGVPAERLPHLFRKFSRLDGEERGREIAGSGLGLAICKGIVEAHRGRIRAESDGLGLGSRFTFTVPAVEEAVILPPPRSRRRRPKTGERPRILCVDDDPQTLRYVRDALTKAGYAPVVTGDPEDVSRLMAEETPRLVLLDMMLPGSDGMELMKDIREVSDVPVIFLSVNGQEEVVARAFDMGAADYVVKPFSPTELAARIRTALRKRAAPELAQPSEPYVRGDLTVDYARRRVTVAGRPSHRHRVPDAGRAFGQRRAGADPRASAATGLGTGQGRGHRAGEKHRQEAAPQAGRGRGQPGLHLRRATRRLPDGEGGGAGGRRLGSISWTSRKMRTSLVTLFLSEY